jgi:hypothetical protein
VSEDLNYQLTEVMPEYRDEHERMLWSLPISGSAFKKVYYDPSKGRQVAIFCPAEDVILPYGTTTVFEAERVTHRMRRTKTDYLKLKASGFYRDVHLPEPQPIHDELQQAKDDKTGFDSLYDKRYAFYETQCYLDIPGLEDMGPDGKETGVPLPYLVTLDRDSNIVLSIYRNWLETDQRKGRRQYFSQYNYIPGFGSYGFGLVHLVGGFARSATSILRQLVDAGTLANLPGGLKTKGLRIKGDDTPIGPGEFRDVDVSMGTIRDNIMPLPYKEPSPTLLQLLQNIIDEGRQFASTADLKISDMSAQAPVGTTLALIERMLKTLSAVQARVHFSMKQELRMLRDIIRDYLPPEYDYDPTGMQAQRAAKKADYAMVEVYPVSDPNASTMSQRLMQYQAALQASSQAPTVYNAQVLHRGLVTTIGLPNPEQVVPDQQQPQPMDAVSENMNLLNAKPVKAFLEQDHKSHIQIHLAAMQDPKIMQLVGQNPQAQALQAAMNAHIAEHIGFAYRAQVDQAMGGGKLPPPGSPLPPQQEAQMSAQIAQAAQQVLGQNQHEAAQAAAQQAAQDPLVQLQQQQAQNDAEKNEITRENNVMTAMLKAWDILSREHVAKNGAGLQDEAAKRQEVMSMIQSAMTLAQQQGVHEDQHALAQQQAQAGQDQAGQDQALQAMNMLGQHMNNAAGMQQKGQIAQQQMAAKAQQGAANGQQKQ